MAYSFKTRYVGNNPDPDAELLRTRMISGLSIPRGDGSNSAGSGAGDGTTHSVGFSSGVRRHVMAYQPIPTDVPRDAKIVGATQRFRVNGSDSTFVGKVVTFWECLREFAYDIAGATFEVWQSGQNWQDYGGRLGSGQDVAAVQLLDKTWQQSDHDFVAAGAGNVLYIDVDVTDELQDHNDAGEPLRYLITSNAASGTTEIDFDNPVQVATQTVPHTHLVVFYLDAIQGYRSKADGTIDRANILDDASGAVAQHVNLRSVNRGSASAWSNGKAWFANTRDTDRNCIFVDSGRAMPGPIDNSDVVGSEYLRFIRTFNNATGQGTPEGSWTLTFTADDECDVTFLLASAPAGSSPETLASALDITTDQVITRSGDDALEILADAFSGTIPAGSVIRFDTRADRHGSAGSLLASLDDVYMARATGVDRNTPDTAHSRPAATAITQQLLGLDTSTIANSGGQTGVIATVSDGGSWTHVKVADPAQFIPGEWVTLCTALDPDDEGRWVDVYVSAVYPIGGGGSYEGQVRLTTDASTPTAVTSPSDFDAQSLLTSGIPLGTLKAPDATTLAVAASTSSQSLTLSAALRASGSVTVEIFDYATGTLQTAAATAAGTTLTLSGSVFPSMQFPVGASVQIAESLSSAPVFLSGQPEPSATLGRKRAYVVCEEFALVA
jgi:hypothetical protein